MSLKTVFIALLLATSFLWAQEKKETTPPAATTTEPQAAHPATITAEDKARKNPIKFTDISVGRGKKIYDTQCALCHGAKGDGKGDLANDMKLNLPDFTKPDTLKDKTDGELFAIIGAGKEPMPDGKRLSETHRWNIVNYLRSLGGATPAKATGKEPEENIILVPQ